MKLGAKIILGLLIVAVVVAAILYSGGAKDITGDNCNLEPVEVNGVHIQTYEQLRTVSGTTLSDAKIEESGIVMGSDGLYTTLCREVLVQ